MNKYYRFRDRWICNQVKNYISSKDDVLDFGCGTGRAGAYIRDEIGCSITGVDVVRYPIMAIKHTLYNGKTLPFSDNQFSVVLSSFVLHHIPKNRQEKIINELKRVTKNKIIVIEDVFRPTIGRWWLYCIEYFCNRLYSSKVPIPLAFRTPTQWESLFTDAGLTITSQKTVKSPTPFLKHIVFTLKTDGFLISK